MPHWLDRVPVGLFAMPVGLLALAGSWRRAQGFGWAFVLPAANAIAWLAVALLTGFLLLYGAKCLRHPRTVAAEFAHPLVSSIMALIPLSLLLCTVYFGTPGHEGWLLLTLLALAVQGIIAVRIVAMLTTSSLPLASITPALYVPPVGGGLVGGMAFNALGLASVAILFLMVRTGILLLQNKILPPAPLPH